MHAPCFGANEKRATTAPLHEVVDVWMEPQVKVHTQNVQMIASQVVAHIDTDPMGNFWHTMSCNDIVFRL